MLMIREIMITEIAVAEGLNPALVVTEKRKRIEDEQTASQMRGQQRAVRRIIAKGEVPGASTRLSRNVQQFVKEMLGGPSSPQAFPSSPTQQELSTWSNWNATRARDIETELAFIRKSHKAPPKAQQDFYVQGAIDLIHKHIKLPPFLHGPGAITVPGGQPMMIQTKRNCEHRLQLAGFPRVTFEWGVKNFCHSPWNVASATILAEKCIIWLKTLSAVDGDAESQVYLIIERWVIGQGVKIGKFGGMDGQKYEKIKEEQARKGLLQSLRKKASALFFKLTQFRA